MIRSLCVFCGSSPGFDPVHGEAARALGGALGQAGIDLVYGGGRVGLMGIVADAAMAAGSRAIGVIPKALADLEVAHEGLTELHIVGSMHARKAMMADLSDGFIALSGGIGTFEELFEIWTWGQLGDHAKPVALLNIAGFYDKLTAFLDDVVTAGFLRDAHRAMLMVDRDPAALVAKIRDYRAPVVEKWIGREQR
ncbi:TIGR00730 family Rossman fold protein [Sphingomonadaceae bacterium G21617-S1]|uniref:LOG family protein n=1 Tax=Rhizorhabdus sp. TaxID=1968843 RepID=UPI00120B72CE|nr:TIGR00730 family Rossman fold protein [Rhizorhabdus sp.]MBD3760873.1 TIGR00730 family Rossman fold protein [Rhizorhabdus sp.]MCZ4343375.1 TIGR00730 family Rossman fold protein [Sphingomonadaceae bacterium G21617-S1]TAK08843.1 MAG: TIGR00730 family Rossman fold protein [Rhizorhabdus sp.]